MKWDEFKTLIIGIGPDTPLGRLVAVRSETDKDILKHFTKDQRRVRSEWMKKQAKEVSQEKLYNFLEDMKNGLINRAGKGR